MALWRFAEEPAEQEAAVRLLVANYEQLGLPYPFRSILLALRYFVRYNTLLICFDKQGNIAGAAGFGLGTEEDGYKDLSKVEVYTVFLLPKYRGSRLFVSGLRELADWCEGSGQVETIACYLQPALPGSALFRKFMKTEKSVERLCGTLELVSVELRDLQQFLHTFK